VAGANDAKAVAAIEKLIGRSIPYVEEPARTPSEQRPAAKAQRERAPKSRRGHDGRTRQPHRPAAARPDETRSRRPAQPARPRLDDGDASHLPAFLLRPVRSSSSSP
jgi:hypothetical protein